MDNFLCGATAMLTIGSATPMGSMDGGIADPRLKPWVTSAQPLCGCHHATL